jgi:hypothetical protein
MRNWVAPVSLMAVLLLSGCGLLKAEVGLPPTEARGGAIKILGIPLLESVDWCAGSPCRLAPPATYIMQNNGLSSAVPQYRAPSWPQPGAVLVAPVPSPIPGYPYRLRRR